MKLILPDSISSPQDIAELIMELHEYSRWVGQEAILDRTHAKHSVEAPTLSAACKGLISAFSDKNSLNQADLDELITSLEGLKNSLPVINITLAALPTNDVKKTLVNWCRQNLADNILVNFSFNATLLGGMVVRFGSHIYDWSFRRQILQNRARLPEVLRNVWQSNLSKTGRSRQFNRWSRGR